MAATGLADRPRLRLHERWKKSQPGLEDVFIHLMESAEDNIQ